MEKVEEIMFALKNARTNIDRWMLYYSLPPISTLEDTVLSTILAFTSSVDECIDVYDHTNDEMLLRMSLITATKFVENESDFLRIFERAPDDLMYFVLSRHELEVLRRISKDDITNQYLLEVFDSIYIPQLKQSILRIILENEPSNGEIIEVYSKSASEDMRQIHEGAEALMCSLNTEV